MKTTKFYDPVLKKFCGFIPKTDVYPHNPNGPTIEALYNKFYGGLTMTVHVETLRPYSVNVESIDFGGNLTINGCLDEPNATGQYVSLYDNRQGSSGCILMIDGNKVSRMDLLRWFSATKNPRVDLTKDDSRYQYVSQANFYQEK